MKGLAWLLLAPLVGTIPAAVPAAAAAPCPAEVVALIDGLYRWHLASQNQPGPLQLNSQKQRFTPQLYEQLMRAGALKPGQGAYLDFDVFSGTQVSTFGARVQGCSPQGTDLLAMVSVQAGLPGRTSEPPQQLHYKLTRDGSGAWRIADIRYRQEDGSWLSTTLRSILEASAHSHH